MSSPWNVHPMTGGDRRPHGPEPITRDPEVRAAHAHGMAPRVPWDVFVSRLDWQQGEHVGLIGPTGQGKTNLLMNLLPLRTYTTVFATKPRDNSMDRLIASGYLKMDKWAAIPPERAPKRVLWPNATTIDSEDHQRKVFKHAYGEIYREGGWCSVVDEGFYMSEILSLKKEMKVMWTQGRSLGISHVVATQRPRWVPLEMYDQSTHLFFWLNNDDESLRRMSGLGVASSNVVRTLVQGLETFQCLYLNTRTGDMMRTRAPAPR
jgi:energy-coupling factor transporter ATP-binding protein EcfA2